MEQYGLAGYNNYGQCGNGNTETQTYLKQVKGPGGVGYLNNIVQITAEETTSHALAADGTVYSWGRNVEGQLGVNSANSSANCYPVKMQKVSNIIQITGGENHLSMLDADGSVWSVGYNGYGQFGIGNAVNAILPIQMQNADGSVLYGVKEIAAGRYSTYIIKEDNTVLSCRL